MMDAYDQETYKDQHDNEQTRVVVRFAFSIAPVKVAIFPLIKKDTEQVTIAKQIYADLSTVWNVEYDESGAIGKRYRRQDEIGTPYCITVDADSQDDKSVTIRERDSMQQVRVPISDIKRWILSQI